MMPMYPMLSIYPVIPNIIKLGISHDEPPTIYALLNSYVNYGKSEDEQTKIKDLASAGRGMIFDFDYPLANGINKSDFETMILNHFLMRRIGYETVTAFKIALNVKLNEIMPMYNKLFESINGWNIFTDGEIVNRNVINSNSSSNTSNSSGSTTNTSDRRFSDTPQNQISDVQNGNYVSEYSYDQDSGSATNSASSSSSDSGSTSENIVRTPGNKMELYAEFLKNRQNIYTMIFKDLDPLFYQLI